LRLAAGEPAIFLAEELFSKRALGTTVAVALTDIAKKSRISAGTGGFAFDQQFAFSSLLPLAALAVLVTLLGKRQWRACSAVQQHFGLAVLAVQFC
jgi:hypothetical protein